MKVRKLALVLIIMCFLISNFVICFGIQIDVNQKEKDKDYKSRNLAFGGVDDIIFTFNDKVLFNGEKKDVPKEKKHIGFC
jgi:hypothetical protein